MKTVAEAGGQRISYQAGDKAHSSVLLSGEVDSGTQKRMAEVDALVRRLKKPGMQAAWCRAVSRTRPRAALPSTM